MKKYISLFFIGAISGFVIGKIFVYLFGIVGLLIALGIGISGSIILVTELEERRKYENRK